MAQGALLVPRRYKPTQFARVNPGHPMARHLRTFLLYPSNHTTGPLFYDAVTGANGSAGATNITARETSEGRALFCNAPSSNATWTSIRTSPGVNANLCTVISRMRLTTKPGAGSRCYPVYLRSSGGAGPAVGFDSSGFCVATLGGSNGIDLPRATGSVDRLNQWVTIGGSYAYSNLGTYTNNAAGRLWENGVRIADGTPSGTTSANDFNSIRIGRDGTGYFGTFTGEILWIAAFTRYLTDEEHAWWHSHAYEVLEQQLHPSFFSLPAAGAATAFSPPPYQRTMRFTPRPSRFF